MKEGPALICEDPLVDHPEVAATPAVISSEPLAGSDVGRGLPVEPVKVERAVAVTHDDFEESERADELIPSRQLASSLESQKGGCSDCVEQSEQYKGGRLQRHHLIICLENSAEWKIISKVAVKWTKLLELLDLHAALLLVR